MLLFEAWRATFGPRTTGWEPLIYSVIISNNFQTCNNVYSRGTHSVDCQRVPSGPPRTASQC